MSFTQLQIPMPMTVEDRGNGQALAVIDYGPEHHLIWVVAMDDSGEIWCAPNPKVRMRSNWTMGRSIKTRAGVETLRPAAVNVS